MEDRDQPWNFHTCKFCPYRSKSTHLMVHHVRLHRNRRSSDLLTCDLRTPEMYECESCEFDTDLKVNLKEHINVFHESKEENSAFNRILGCYRCKRCQFQTHSLLVITKHVNNCTEMVPNRLQTSKTVRVVKWFECEQCNSKFRIKSKLNRHSSLKHGTKEAVCWYKCDHCFYKTNRRFNLKKHKRTCALQKFRCVYCPIKFKNNEALRKHVQQRHCKVERGVERTPEATKRFKCDHCESQFNTATQLKSHLLTHSAPEDVTWFHCDHCFFKTKWRGSLRNHISKRCSFVQRFKCAHCRFKAKNREALRSHLEIHQSIKPLKTQQKLDIVMIEGMKYFKCEYCDGKFKTERTLKGHYILKHAPPEEGVWYKCDRCPFQARRTDTLKQHSSKCSLKTINGRKHQVTNQRKIKQRPETVKDTQAINKKVFTQRMVGVKRKRGKDDSLFKCEQCEWKFRDQHKLKRHFNLKHATAEEGEWFTCERCSYQTRRKDYLKNHSLKCALQNFETVYCGVAVKTEIVNVEQKLVTTEIGRDKSFKCNHCEYRTDRRGHLQKHNRSRHRSVHKSKGARHVMQKHLKTENSVTTNQTNYKVPRKRVLFGNRKRYRCEKCGLKCRTKCALKRHLISMHGETKNITKRPKQSLKCGSIKNFECALCGVRSKTEGALKKHVQGKHPVNNCAKPKTNRVQIKCDQCQFETNSKDILKQHSLQCCISVQKLKCVYCPVKVENNKSLRQHMVQHHGAKSRNRMRNKQEPKNITVGDDKRFKCEQCDSTFKNNSALKRHFLSKHAAPEDITWFECDFCFFKTKRKDSLKNHSLHCKFIPLSKPGVSPGKTKSKLDLKPTKSPNKTIASVVKTKVTGKQFLCELCDYRFSSNENLKRHFMAKHETPENILWLKCDRCWYQTIRKDRLSEHNQKCNFVPSLRCVYCVFRGEDKEGLIYHVKEKHSHRDDSKWLQCEQFLLSF